MTIVVQGDQYILEQIEKQLSKLVEVVSIEQCNLENTIVRELALIKVNARSNRIGIIETANIFRAHIVDVGVDSLVIEGDREVSKK